MSVAVDHSMVRFNHIWKVEWSDFNQLPTKSISEKFNITHNNVALFWTAEFSATRAEIPANKFAFYLNFDDGPLPVIKGVALHIDILQQVSSTMKSMVRVGDITRGLGYGWKDFDNRNGSDFRKAYGFKGNEPLTCQVKLKIPSSVFAFSFPNPLTTTAPSWLFSLFKQAIDGEGEPKFPTVKLASREGKVFRCHQLIIQAQSEPLAMLLRHPPDNDQDAYVFEAWGTSTLKAILQYLYTDQVTFKGLSISSIMDIADAAEQYELNPLKEACRSALWERAPGKPEECFDIVRFASVRIADMLYLKHRAMDVLAANYEKLSLNEVDLTEKFGGSYFGNMLKTEFGLYCQRRKNGYFAAASKKK